MLAAPAAAQAPAAPPAPSAWWAGTEPELSEAQDPLAGRRPGRGGFTPHRALEAIEASYHRLWGLPPLQSQLVRRGESVFELWVRPEGSDRQAVIRIVNRSDGRSFLQARAGIACCRPEIARRVDIDRPLEPGWAARLAHLAAHAEWSQAEDVYVDEGDGGLQPVCVGGVSYDLYRVTVDAAVHLRRDCGAAEVGSIAALLAPIVGASLGRDGRFDLAFPRGADFSAAASAHRALVSGGGRLSPVPRD